MAHLRYTTRGTGPSWKIIENGFNGTFQMLQNRLAGFLIAMSWSLIVEAA
jgi:hypothetical protein